MLPHIYTVLMPASPHELLPLCYNVTRYSSRAAMEHLRKAKGRGAHLSPPLTNGEVIKVLKTLPDDQPFGALEEGQKPLEFLRQLYLPLRQLFSTTTRPSQANCSRIQQITRHDLKVPESLSSRFCQWRNNPLGFWERLVETLPRYSDQPAAHRARIFLEGADALNFQLDNGRILRRFMAVSAYSLLRRAAPASSTDIRASHIAGFLEHIGLPQSKANIEKYGDILRRG